MRSSRGLRTTSKALAASVLIAMTWWSVASANPASADSGHVLIEGSGSSWAQNAVNQWIADVQSQGIQVVFTGSGSAQGRKDFSFYTTDFAVSDIGFQGVDPVTGEADTSNGRPYAYLPITSGGTAFAYQIRVGGQLVRNLRLSGQTLAKIFTNQITNWNDPAITADNNGHALPSLAIIPVVHSEGSGSTAQFTAYLNDQYPSIWQPFLGKASFTEYFPRKGYAIAQNGSDGVMNYVSSAAANGAIGYDEYSYALAKNYPVVKLKNAAGYFTLPTQYNVAVALTKATINTNPSSPNYLLQQLHGVYTNSAPQTYAMSSYSYLVLPTGSTDKRLTTAKRQTLADYLKYSICTGQAEIGPIGYSSLPVNLVQAGFDQIAKLKQADPNVDVSTVKVTACNNPTFDPKNPSKNYLAEIAPVPPACDKVGAGPCSDNTGQSNSSPTQGGKAGTSPNGTKTTSSGQQSNGGQPSAGATGPGNSASQPGGAQVDPVTGQTVGAPPSDGSGDGTVQLVAVPADISGAANASTTSMGWVIALELVLLLVGPPLLVLYYTRRRRRA